jgi:CubicO group peptidase (beta-lactamase class C family)
MGSFGRGGGGYCAYVGGQRVVDLWGGSARSGEPWQAETAAVLMSATKGFASICLQILVDRGAVDVDAAVATYWPEFAQNGKERTTVRHLLLHTAGVVGFDRMYDVVRPDGNGWGDLDTIAVGLAESAPSYEPGTKYAYHALSIGWLVAEIVRRVDGRSIGRFFADEIAEPLGLESWIGLPPELMSRVAHVHDIRLDYLPRLLRTAQKGALATARDPQKLLGRAFLGDGTSSGLDHVETLFNSPNVLTAEFPAGGGVSTARGLARCWAMMAGRGELDGVRVLSSEIVDQWGRVVSTLNDIAFAELPPNRVSARLANTPVPRTLGHLGNSPMPGLGQRFGPNENAFGAEGLGGQYGFCDLDANIAVGYVRSELAFLDVLQPTLTRELYRCARANGVNVTLGTRSLSQRAGDAVIGAYARRQLAVPASTH